MIIRKEIQCLIYRKLILFYHGNNRITKEKIFIFPFFPLPLLPLFVVLTPKPDINEWNEPNYCTQTIKAKKYLQLQRRSFFVFLLPPFPWGYFCSMSCIQIIPECANIWKCFFFSFQYILLNFKQCELVVQNVNFVKSFYFIYILYEKTKKFRKISLFYLFSSFKIFWLQWILFLFSFFSTINPILYNVMSHRYRIAFRETLCSRKRGFYSSASNGFVRDQSSFRETTIAAASRDHNLNYEGSQLVSWKNFRLNFSVDLFYSFKAPIKIDAIVTSLFTIQRPCKTEQ